MTPFFLRFMEWLYHVMIVLVDQFLGWLSIIRILQIIRGDI